MLSRCCADTLKWANLRQPTEGLELTCRWCPGYLKYERIDPDKPDSGCMWKAHDRVGDFIARETSPEQMAWRRQRTREILGKDPEDPT